MLRTYKPVRSVISRLAALAAAGIFAFTASSAVAQNDASSSQAEVIVPTRITQPINPDQRVTLSHNVHPMAKPQFDQGAAPGATATGRIMLVLKRSGMQEAALKQYLGDLQNPGSPNYRKFLTPAQFGKQYGISDTDLTTVTSWLQSQGFKIEKVPLARNVIEFSGNFAQIQQAFHTTIHRYMVNGEQHFANATDPQIPTALAPVVAGIASLNDFRPKSSAVRGPKAHFDPESKTIKPDLTLFDSKNNAYLYVNPADAATIYDSPNANLNKNFAGGQTWDGTGVTIGIAGDSNITVQDVANYRAAFLNDTTTTHLPNVIVDGNDPGLTGDEGEALLDNEVAAGIAPGATINFYTAADTDFQSGLFLAIFRALDDNAVSILNVSFGACEADQTIGGNLQIMNMWEQAAAQGISVTVSTGDSGSAGCDNPNSEVQAQSGLAVNGLASTPYNIAVGGTDFPGLSTGTPFGATAFLDPTAAAPYVTLSSSGTSPYFGTALKYIPEKPWNDSPASNNALAANSPAQIPTSSGNTTSIAGAGGGPSTAAVCNGTVGQDGNGNQVCSIPMQGYAKPPFQIGLTQNVPSQIASDGVRDVPDVSLFASDGAYGSTWAVCADSTAFPTSDGSTFTDCQLTNGQLTTNTTFSGVGGTSAAAPAFAGMLAVISQSQGGKRLGQVNNVLYNLANQSSLYNSLFHDVASGNNSVYCTGGLLIGCGTNSFLTGYDAGTGYDYASGLGSVDVTQLINNWSKAVFAPTTTTFSISGGSASIVHGTALTFNVGVTSTGGTPIGDVSILNNSGVSNNGSIGFLTLNNGQASMPLSTLPGGTYNVYAYYGGDVKNASSLSQPVAVTITPEPSTAAAGNYITDPLTGNTLCDDATQGAPPCNGVSVPYGYASSISSQPQGASGSSTVASGAMILTDSAGPLTYNGTSNASISVPISSNGVASYNNYTNQNQSFSVASHSLSVSYGGDQSYKSSSQANAVTFTVTQAQTSLALTATQPSTSSTVTLQAQVNTDSIGAFPTGSVVFKSGNTVLGTVSTPTATGFVTNQNGQGSTVAAVYQLQVPSSALKSSISVKKAKLDQAPFSWKLTGEAAAMAFVFFLTIPARRRSWRNLIGLVIFAITISTVLGCGSSGNNDNGGGGIGTTIATYNGDANYAASTSQAVPVTVTQ